MDLFYSTKKIEASGISDSCYVCLARRGGVHTPEVRGIHSAKNKITSSSNTIFGPTTVLQSLMACLTISAIGSGPQTGLSRLRMSNLTMRRPHLSFSHPSSSCLNLHPYSRSFAHSLLQSLVSVIHFHRYTHPSRLI